MTGLGRLISDSGRKTTIRSVLDSSKRHKARKVDRLSEKHGPCEFLVVNKQCKYNNLGSFDKAFKKVF